MSDIDIDTSQITNWRSIITLIVFVITNVLVLFPIRVPIYLPVSRIRHALERTRILRPRDAASGGTGQRIRGWTRCHFPLNLVTAPIIADLFLLAILAIGRKEVHDGTVGTNHIAPIDIMVFFFTLAYIAISIDASGLIRFMAYQVLKKGGKNGYLLYFYLYCLFLGLSAITGNDPVVLSGTSFLAYMTRAARNIENPRAWLYTQLAVANIGSAVLVSSNPTNLVLAGSFEVKFVDYTANMIVPVLVSAVVLCPCLYLVFRDEKLIPKVIEMDQLSEHAASQPPRNPNIPMADGIATPRDDAGQEQIPLEDVLNPYLDKPSAIFGTSLICTTLVVILVLNALTSVNDEHPVFWITLPAAVVMFVWDLTCGWLHRKTNRAIAGKSSVVTQAPTFGGGDEKNTAPGESPSVTAASTDREKTALGSKAVQITNHQSRESLESLVDRGWKWARITFPTATTVLSLLPYALIPFSLAMFVLVQALVSKGWVAVFAYGWKHWVDATSTVGAIGGMGFISVLLCNFAGTNIGTAILLCRMIQAWVQIEATNGSEISQRTFWATIYAMALGVNYGAFSGLAISASLAGLLWRDILRRKHIDIRARDFLRYNFPIIAITMVIGSVVLVGEVYITRGTSAYESTTA